MLLINIKWSKTNQFGHSRQIPISPMTGSCLCPVTAYTNMVSLLPAKDSDPAFCLVSNKRKLIPYTYAQFHKQLKYLIRKTGRHEKLYSSHGLRRAGCTLASKSSIILPLIQHHGDWLSDAVKLYLTFEFDQKLTVCQSMCSCIQAK